MTEHQTLLLDNDDENTPQPLDSDISGLEKYVWPQTLAEMVDVIESRLSREKDIKSEQANRLAKIVVFEIAQYFGGRPVYLPMGKRIEQALRDQDIWRDFTGDNIDRLIKKYKLSHQSIRDAIQRQRLIETAKVQRSLISE
ncbi:Uncharacterised protein [BD1-7 clade bacterium]|uniref:Mor transcription activator domain-containing protein n=1 Tax=BD1-7 clade bacterium TaxID=2029982 RepID=A0A5S9Q2K7_9GAMM|nr:Uncharacterised protein [BD1-7 clade bacterium]CAA0111802.1 Uncharacterised protein [BD1-7 clade bacterium]